MEATQDFSLDESLPLPSEPQLIQPPDNVNTLALPHLQNPPPVNHQTHAGYTPHPLEQDSIIKSDSSTANNDAKVHTPHSEIGIPPNKTRLPPLLVKKGLTDINTSTKLQAFHVSNTPLTDISNGEEIDRKSDSSHERQSPEMQELPLSNPKDHHSASIKLTDEQISYPDRSSKSINVISPRVKIAADEGSSSEFGHSENEPAEDINTTQHETKEPLSQSINASATSQINADDGGTSSKLILSPESQIDVGQRADTIHGDDVIVNEDDNCEVGDEPPEEGEDGYDSEDERLTNAFADVVVKVEKEVIKKNPTWMNKSLFLFAKDNPIRRWCISVVEHQWFDRVIIFCIIVNCAFLAATDPLEPKDSKRNIISSQSEKIFIAIFGAEMTLKIVAHGLVIGDNAYLKDRWNWIDFASTLIGFLSLLPGVDNYSSIRTVRVLRPLRALGRIKGLRAIVDSIMQSVMALIDVLVLSMFVFAIFGVFGLELFSGAMKYHCIDKTTGEMEDVTFSCGATWSARKCPEGYQCIKTSMNPDDGYTSFDNVGSAFILIFRVMSLDNWSVVMYQTIDSTSSFSVVYFILLVAITSFFVINLALAVITNSFNTLKKADRAEDEVSSNGELSGSSIWSLDSMEPWSDNPIIIFFFNVATSPFFNKLSLVFIISNTVFLALQTPNVSERKAMILGIGNMVFSYFFLLEMIVKVVGLGLVEYVRDKFNVFDGIIAILSMIEIWLVGSAIFIILRMFRLIRVARLLKIFRAFQSLRILSATVIKSLGSVAKLLWIILIFIFISALLGMELFGGKLDPVIYRPNFDSLFSSMLVVFQVLTLEGWSDIMYACMKATSEAASLYFIMLVLFGNYIILYLFLAILITTFSTLSEQARAARVAYSSFSMSRMFSWIKPAPTLVTPANISNSQSDGVYQNDEATGSIKKSPSVSTAVDDAAKQAAEVSFNLNLSFTKEEGASESSSRKPRRSQTNNVRFVTSPRSAGENSSRRRKTLAETYARRKDVSGKSLGVLGPENKMRLLLHKIISGQLFEKIIIVLILISSLTLAFYSPKLDEDSSTMIILNQMDIFFTSVFAFEMVAKIFTYGFIFGNHAYFQDPWNILDAIVVITSTTGLFISSKHINSIRVLRLLRILRPLRLLSRHQGIRIVVNAIILSIPSFINIMILSFLLWLMFAILGVQLFGGEFNYCTDSRVVGRDQCFGLFIDDSGMTDERMWKNQYLHFDSVPDAMKTLFVMSTFDNWVAVMYYAVDSAGVGKQPIHNNNPVMILYFVAFIVFGGFFMTNLFVSVVVDNFHQIQNEYDGHGLLADNQKQWFDAQKLILKTIPAQQYRRPNHPFRKKCYKLTRHKYYDIAFAVVILLNVSVMGLSHDRQTSEWDLALVTCDWIFTSIFGFEVALKLLAFGRGFFHDNWNIFDMATVILPIIGTIIQEYIPAGFNMSIIRVFRVFRAMRIFRLIKSTKSIYKLFKTMIYSLPSLVNIGSLLFLIFYIYAVLGMSLFGNVIHSESGLDEHTNFSTFLRSMLTLFRIVTFDNWSEVYNACSVQPPYCDESLGNCGMPLVSTAYFYSFCVIAPFILLNIYIAVILENFNIASEEEKAKLKEQDVLDFCAAWVNMSCPENTNILPTNHLSKLLQIVGPPLGVPAGKKGVIGYLAKLNIPDHKGFVHYSEVMKALTMNLMEVETLPEIKLRKDIEDRTRRAFPGLDKLSASEGQVCETVAAMVIQRYFRRWKKYHRKAVQDRRSVRQRRSITASSKASLLNQSQSKGASSQSLPPKGIAESSSQPRTASAKDLPANSSSSHPKPTRGQRSDVHILPVTKE